MPLNLILLSLQEYTFGKNQRFSVKTNKQINKACKTISSHIYTDADQEGLELIMSHVWYVIDVAHL